MNGKQQFGVVGLGKMGANLALQALEKETWSQSSSRS